MLRAKAMLDEIKEGIINAYEAKTGIKRTEISRMMNEESCFNAKKAVDLGFANGILYADSAVENSSAPVIFSRTAVVNSLMSKMSGAPKISASAMPTKPIKSGTAYDILESRVTDLAKR
jgi:ATP-dependent Clp protease protease subunit